MITKPKYEESSRLAQTELTLSRTLTDILGLGRKVCRVLSSAHTTGLP